MDTEKRTRVQIQQTHKTLLLTLLTLTQLLVVIDGSIVNIALPALKNGLDFSNTSLQWVITAYILSFGGMLLLGGRIADRFGRRKLLIAGTAGFTTTSLLLGLSQTSLMLIVLRSIQGVSAAVMASAALAILLTVFREGHERNRALSIWGLAGSAGGAIGVLLGGILTEQWGWRSIFLVNVPVGIVILSGMQRYLQEDTAKASAKPLDVPGAIAITSGIMGLIYALAQAPLIGWTAPTTVVSAIAGIILCAGFFFIEKRSPHPIVLLSIFRLRSVSAGNIAMLVLTAMGMGQFYFNSLYLQNILRYSSADAGLAFLPIPVAIAATIMFVPRLLKRFGYRHVLTIGVILMGVGACILTTFNETTSYVATIIPAFVLLGAGLGMGIVATNVAATSGVTHEQSGMVSGLVNTSQQVGGAFGIAILTLLASDSTSSATTFSMSGYHMAYLGVVGLVILLLIIALQLRSPGTLPNNTKAVVNRS
jgi:EmrB/QacA subfamily drug resistance transporter